MNLKRILIVVLAILTVITIAVSFNRYKNNKRANVKVPVLLYHNFV